MKHLSLTLIIFVLALIFNSNFALATNCNPGYFFDSKITNCEPCPVGYYCEGGSNLPIPCPPGHYCKSGEIFDKEICCITDNTCGCNTKAIACPIGEYSLGFKNYECDSCDVYPCDPNTGNFSGTCISTQKYTKCIKLPEGRMIEIDNATQNADQWTGFIPNRATAYKEFTGLPLSGHGEVLPDMSIGPAGATICYVDYPFIAQSSKLDCQGGTDCCANDGFVIHNIQKLDTDVCPDGFFAIPYDASCGEGQINNANIPNCSDDTSGTACLIPNTTQKSLCALGISQIKTSTGLSFALYAEKYTEPALAIEYNNGKCYGMLDLGRASNTINITHNNEIYHLID